MSYPDYKKVVVVGDSGVGKTCILIRFCDGNYTDNFIATIGGDYKIGKVPLDGGDVHLQVYDTAGQERFRSVTNSYYRGAHCALVVFDVTNEASFSSIQSWFDDVKKALQESAKLFLVGSKVDLQEKRVVNEEKAREYARNNNIEYFETSAKENRGIKELFGQVAVAVSGKVNQKPSNVVNVKGQPSGSGECPC